MSPEGKLYFHSQDRAIHAADVVAFLAPVRREVSGRTVMIWDGAPMHRRQVIHAFLADGAAQRRHVARLPADAPELKPGEGLWAHLKGVELRHVCGVNRAHLRAALRDAVKRVRRTPRLSKGFFQGATL